MTAAQKQTSTAAPSGRLAPSSETPGRKPWKRKSTVDVVLNQIHKQEERVAELQEQLTHEKRELEKLHKAKEVLEAK
jgi:hypothetical protein